MTNTPNPTGDKPVVTQRARDAAKALLDQLAIRFHQDGTFRDWDNTVEAFARFEQDTLSREGREASLGYCPSCTCDLCQRQSETNAITTALADDANARCWSCSCGWIGCYTTADIEYMGGEPAECHRCCRERLSECDPPRVAALSTAPASPDQADQADVLRERIAELEALAHESLFHLRLDEAAKAYHDKACAALKAQEG